MGQVSFLNDDECRAAIVRLSAEAARVWAPDEADLVDVVADEYLRQVRAAGRILYPVRTADQGLDFGGSELWLLIILPIVTGFVGNLLAEVGLETWKELRSQAGPRWAGDEPRVTPPDPERIRTLIAPVARAGNINSRQIEQLAQLFADVMRELLTADDQGTVTHAGSFC